ncbi:unnamed protein product [Brachionus calyciflorus]|uniref:RING-type domain-containing protein n=1 Tax=Brachionus calyciflorus TaxID=104777 RepID=A0A814NBC0_9BILA|nr:unnamed protein product [Brachionus calyciflorus]
MSEKLKFAICPNCFKIFEIPKFLPCGETICSKCVPKANRNGKIDCIYCGKDHIVPKKGFPLNKACMKFLEYINQSIRDTPKYKNLEYEVEKFKEKFFEFKAKIQPSQLMVTEYCKNLINEVDLSVEKKIQKLNDLRDKLIEQIKDYEKKCMIHLETLKSELEIELNFYKNRIFDSKKVIFTENIENVFIGELEHKNLDQIDYISFYKTKIFKLPYSIITLDFKELETSENIYVFSYKDKLGSYFMRIGKVYKINDGLKIERELNFADQIISQTCLKSKNHILFYGKSRCNGEFIKIYNVLDLNYLYEINNDEIMSCIGVDQVLCENLYANEKFYFLSWNTGLIVICQQTKSLFKRVKFPINGIVLKITDNNVIILYSNEEMKIVYLDFDGKIRQCKHIKNFTKDVHITLNSSNQIKFCLIDQDSLEL